MNRLYALAVGALALGGVALVSGSPVVMKTVDEKKEGAEKPDRPTTAAFNIVAVKRDFGWAKHQAWVLNNKRREMSREMVAWRTEFVQHQRDLQKHPQHPEAELKEQRMVTLSRMIEDKDRQINKQLNDDTSVVIADLHDKISLVVNKVAEMNGYHIVFAYPDAVTPAGVRSPHNLELKLKPPAAQPYYVAPKADVTAVVVKTLNAWFPAVDAKTGEPVDTSKLDDVPLPALGQNSSKIQLPPGTVP